MCDKERKTIYLVGPSVLPVPHSCCSSVNSVPGLWKVAMYIQMQTVQLLRLLEAEHQDQRPKAAVLSYHAQLPPSRRALASLQFIDPRLNYAHCEPLLHPLFSCCFSRQTEGKQKHPKEKAMKENYCVYPQSECNCSHDQMQST